LRGGSIRVAIAGAGFSGSYLARRLVVEGIAKPEEIEIFDPMNHRTKCGQTPCGWGIHQPTLEKAIELCDLGNPDDFILESFDEILFGNVMAKADLCTFDKPKFIKACLDGFAINRHEFVGGNFDLIIDATAGRKIIGPSNTAPLFIHTKQVRLPKEAVTPLVKTMEILPLKVIGARGYGYVWRFPLGDSVHYGFGLVGEKTPPWLMLSKHYVSTICGCRGVIRLSSPRYSQPIVIHNPYRVIAVGESAGMISSATGGGCKEAIDGIEVLIKCWGDWEKYEDRLIREFRWADDEFRLVRKLVSGRKLGIRDIRVIQKNSKRVGFKLSIKETAGLIKYILFGGAESQLPLPNRWGL